MGAHAATHWVAPLLQLLPGPLLRTLDRWSHRRAVARQRARQQAWLTRRDLGNPASNSQKGT